MRISLYVPFYSIICLLCIYLPSAAVYLRPWLEVAQAHCLATYFLLLCEYVSPNAEERGFFFATLEVKDEKATKKNKGKKIDGMQWFKVRRFVMHFNVRLLNEPSNNGLAFSNITSWQPLSRLQLA